MRVLVSGNGAATAAPAAFAELDTATGQEGGSDAGAAGVTANEPAPAAEPSSLTFEPEAAAADAAEQVVQPQAEAQAAGATPADAATADAPVADATTADSQAVAAPPQRAPRPQQPQPPPQQRKQWQGRPPSIGGRGGRGSAGGRAYSGGRGGGRESAAQPEEPVGVPIPPEELWFDRGDVVPCRVTWANSRGARVATVRDPRITGCAAALCFCTLPLALPAAAALPRSLQVCLLGAATGAWLPHATPLTQALSSTICGAACQIQSPVQKHLLC